MMNVFTKQHLSTSIILLLIVLNLTSLGTIWFLQSSRPPEAGSTSRGPVKNFLEQELGLTPKQTKQFERLRQQHFQESQAINEEMRLSKEAIMQEVFADSPNSVKAEALAEEIGEGQAELENLRFQHFLALKSVCQPEQLEKFQRLFHELLPPREPPNEGRPPQPGPNPPQGRPPSVSAPKEAIEACRGKNQGERCQFTAPHGSISGTCRSVDSQFACVPKNGRVR